MNKMERIDKIISNMGYGSRKQVKDFIRSGRVRIGEEVVKTGKTKVNPDEEEIYFDGERVIYREYIYLMMNKPDGVVSSTDDPLTRTVVDLLDESYRIFQPFPVGRLDKDTEGLLILSNDGKMSHDVLSPKKGVNKKYYVEVEGSLVEKHKDIFDYGIELDDGYQTMPSKLEIIETGENSKAYLTIQEGKYHQVKRMFQALSMEVLYLKRVKMGGLELDEDLEPGEYRELSEEEKNLLMEG